MGERSNGAFNLRSVARSLSLKRKGNSSTQSNHSRHALPFTAAVAPAAGGCSSSSNSNGVAAAASHATTASVPAREAPRQALEVEAPLASLGYSSLNYVHPPDPSRLRRNASTKHQRAQHSYDMLGSHAADGRAHSRGTQLPLRASRSDESLAVDPNAATAPATVEPPKLQSTARGAPSGPPSYASSPPITSPYIVKSPQAASENGWTAREDPLQNVKDHMRANADLIGNGPFFSVQRGWKKGIYMSRAEADRQIKNFPGPVIKTFENLDEAIAFLKPDAAAALLEPKDEDQDEEVLERARIFSDLAGSGQVELKRAISLSSERKAARNRAIADRKGRLDPAASLTSPAPAISQSLPAASPSGFQEVFQPVPQSPLADSAADPLDRALPLDLVGGPSRLATLLPVRHLDASKSFYVDVLGMSCSSHHEGAQAVLASSSGAVICLRSLEVAPPMPSGSALARNGSLGRSGSINGRTGRPTLPPMEEDSESPTAPASAPDSPSRFDSRPLRSPVPPPPPPRSATALMSGITTLVEHRGSLSALHGTVSQRINSWAQQQETRQAAEGRHGSMRAETAKVLSNIEDKPWGCQEFHVSDPDGHRLIFTSPLQAL